MPPRCRVRSRMRTPAHASRLKAGCATTTPGAPFIGSTIRRTAHSPRKRARRFSPKRRKNFRSRCALRASRRIARDRRIGGVGRRECRASRRGVRGIAFRHRRSEKARADLEERALRRRRVRMAASGQHARRRLQSPPKPSANISSLSTVKSPGEMSKKILSWHITSIARVRGRVESARVTLAAPELGTLLASVVANVVPPSLGIENIDGCAVHRRAVCVGDVPRNGLRRAAPATRCADAGAVTRNGPAADVTLNGRVGADRRAAAGMVVAHGQAEIQGAVVVAQVSPEISPPAGMSTLRSCARMRGSSGIRRVAGRLRRERSEQRAIAVVGFRRRCGAEIDFIPFVGERVAVGVASPNR